PEAEGDILEPETADSWEAGLKGAFLGGRLTWDAAYFEMDFENLVVAENVGGLPALANAGSERFRGFEAEAEFRPTDAFALIATYAHHEAKFTDYRRLRPDGSIQQLAGNYLELSPKDLAAVGAIYAPEEGLQASATWKYVGERFLNKGNTSIAESYSTFDVGVGYRIDHWLFRIDGANLSDRRDPATESEL